MKATLLCVGGLLGLAAAASLAHAVTFVSPVFLTPLGQAPHACCCPGFYTMSPNGMVFGPNYWVRPPFEPFNGMLPNKIGRFIESQRVSPGNPRGQGGTHNWPAYGFWGNYQCCIPYPCAPGCGIPPCAPPPPPAKEGPPPAVPSPVHYAQPVGPYPMPLPAYGPPPMPFADPRFGPPVYGIAPSGPGRGPGAGPSPIQRNPVPIPTYAPGMRPRSFDEQRLPVKPSSGPISGALPLASSHLVNAAWVMPAEEGQVKSGALPTEETEDGIVVVQWPAPRQYPTPNTRLQLGVGNPNAGVNVEYFDNGQREGFGVNVNAGGNTAPPNQGPMPPWPGQSPVPGGYLPRSYAPGEPPLPGLPYMGYTPPPLPTLPYGAPHAPPPLAQGHYAQGYYSPHAPAGWHTANRLYYCGPPPIQIQPPPPWLMPQMMPDAACAPPPPPCGTPTFPTHRYVRSPRDFFMWSEALEDQTRRERRPAIVP